MKIVIIKPLESGETTIKAVCTKEERRMLEDLEGLEINTSSFKAATEQIEPESTVVAFTSRVMELLSQFQAQVEHDVRNKIKAEMAENITGKEELFNEDYPDGESGQFGVGA